MCLCNLIKIYLWYCKDIKCYYYDVIYFLSKFIIYVYYFFFVYVKKNVFFDECFIFGDFIIKKNS